MSTSPPISAPAATAATASTPVEFEERDTAGGLRVGVVRLNEPRKLNALSIVMIEAMLERLEAWEDDAGIAMVLLEASGEKAFCAGGDIRSLYESAKTQPAEDSARLAYHFFDREYRLDFLLHSYAKPILAWGHGLVMGGGLGLLAGCSHRVVTAASRLSMPEIGIGLFPDVGASWFLSRVPGRIGLMLALTAAPMNAADALFAGLADYRLDHESKPAVLDALLATAWTGDRHRDDAMLDALLAPLAVVDEPGPLARHFEALRAACAKPHLIDVMAALKHVASNGDEWLAQAVKRMDHACPSTLWLSTALQRRTAHRSLIEVLGIECLLASQRVLQPVFLEGVRAVLIDKDGQPKWNEELGEVMPAWIDAFFDELPVNEKLPLCAYGAARTSSRFKNRA